MLKTTSRVALCLLVACLGVVPAAAQSSSASFILHQQTLNAGGAPASSASFRVTGSVGQEVTVGVSSASVLLQSGFWSFAGAGKVPLFLTLGHTAGLAEHVDMFWSGNSAPYDIYRATDCGDVTASFFDTTSANSYVAVPPLPGIVCFLVLDAPPVPAPPATSPHPGARKESP